MALAPDGSWVAASDRNSEVRVWALPDLAQRHVLLGHAQAVYALEASPDGRWLATGSYDHTVRLWDAATGALLATLEGHTLGVRRVRFSPDGKTLASAGWDRTVRLWDVTPDAKTGKPSGAALRVCSGHADHVFGIDWAPDGSWLASAGRDGTVRIWDPSNCRALATFTSDEAQVYALAVWGNGKGFSYAGSSVHRFELQPLLSPSEQFHQLEKRTGLILDEEQLVAIPDPARAPR